MTLDQLNELINRGYVGLGLMAIAFVLLLFYIDKSRKQKSKN